MAELDKLDNVTLEVNITGIIPAPWQRLLKIKNKTEELQDKLDMLEFAEILHVDEQIREVQKTADTLMMRVSLYICPKYLLSPVFMLHMDLEMLGCH